MSASRDLSSRRAVLTAGIGAVAATVASALGRAAPVSAANDDPVTVGGTFTGTLPTSITNTTGDGIVAKNTATSASGLFAHATAATGGTYGAFGRADSTSGTGVAGVDYATSGSTTGVYGESRSQAGVGVYGLNVSTATAGGFGSPMGVYGESRSAAGSGVSGKNTAAGIGVGGEANVAGGRGVAGFNLAASGLGSGVQGTCFSPNGAGVLGTNGNGTGVRGTTSGGIGVRGDATTGVAVRAYAPASGATALRVTGRASFSRSGRASIPAGKSYVDVTPAGSLANSSNVLATLQKKRSGVYVAAARVNYPSAGKARIYLNKVASNTSGTPVAWFVLG